MAPKLKTLSSREIITFLQSFGFEVTHQRGSHIKLQRKSSWGKDTLIIPERKQIAKGTIKSIFKQASRFVPQNDLQAFFYNE